MENPIKINDLGVPLFSETCIHMYIYTYLCVYLHVYTTSYNNNMFPQPSSGLVGIWGCFSSLGPSMSDDLKPILMRLYQPRSQESFVFPTKWEAATKRSPQISNATYFAYTKTRTTILPHFLPNPLRLDIKPVNQLLRTTFPLFTNDEGNSFHDALKQS